MLNHGSRRLDGEAQSGLSDAFTMEYIASIAFKGRKSRTIERGLEHEGTNKAGCECETPQKMDELWREPFQLLMTLNLR